MWMLDPTDHTPISTKLRPLIPRPNIPPCSIPPSCSCITNPNFLQWTHPIMSAGRREAPLVSTRWNPTPEQLESLEEMYRRGIRTPSAEQIQQIAAKLRRLGKIEGKNVFYWFQNHKARERQKKRRQLELTLTRSQRHTRQTTGVSRSYIEIEHHKMSTPSKCTTTPSQEESGASMLPQNINININLGAAENEPPSPSSSPSSLSSSNTLQLFPLDHINQHHIIQNKFPVPCHFIEFLPTKK